MKKFRLLSAFLTVVMVVGSLSAFSLSAADAKSKTDEPLVPGIDEETGSIEKGKKAEMIVTDKNPLEDLKTLRHPDMVIMRDNIIRSPQVKKIPEVESELDKWL